MKQVTEFFDGMTMPEPCARRIASRMEAAQRIKKEGYIVKKPEKKQTWQIAFATACVVLIAMAGIGVVRSGSRLSATEPVVSTAPEQMQQEKADLEAELENKQQEYAETRKTIHINDWLVEEEGLLYFRPQEKRIYWEEISERISAEEAYIYARAEEDGTVIFLAIGGEYDVNRGLDSIGWYGGIWDGEWTVRGENYLDARWYLPAAEQMETARKDAMVKEKAKADFDNGLRYTEGRIIYKYWNEDSAISYTTDDFHTPFTDCVDGRVTFIANGESIDITGKFSEDEPYTYIYTDSYLLTHYIAIGGTAEDPGWLEMIHASWETGAAKFCTGTGVNTWNNPADERYGWETRAKEIFEPYGVHWPS